MSRAVFGRRLACPVRLALAAEIGENLDGAWWPRTSSVAQELPDLLYVLLGRLGQITDINVNWSSLDGPLDLDAMNSRGRVANADPKIRHQHMMTITGRRARANVLVVPSHTAGTLARTVMRRAARLPIPFAEQDTQEFRTAEAIVRAARRESALRAERLAKSVTGED